MRRNHPIWQIFLIAGALSFGTACNSSDFTSSTSKADGAKAGAGSDAGADDSKAVGTSTSTATNAGTQGSPQPSGGGVNGVDGVGAHASSAATSGCLARKAGTYHLVVAFDNSQSQLRTDPSRLRTSGGKAFAARLAAIADANPTLTINLATLSFASAPTAGAHGWQRLSGATVANVQADITALTATPILGTNFSAALAMADSMLGQVGASASNTTTRSYVILITDGEPTDPLPKIASTIDGLTKNRGAAMITMGTGAAVGVLGAQVLSQMALPKVGIVDAKHVGQFIRAETQDQMSKIGDLLVDAVTTCN